MTHTYSVSGMTCGGCEATVQRVLSEVPHVEAVSVDRQKGEATVRMDTHVPTEVLQEALKPTPKYQLREARTSKPAETPSAAPQSFFQTYKPILLIFAILTIVALVAASNLEAGMRYFMAGFFLTFSFFKLLDLKGFADSYATYDLLASVLPAWGFVYAFVELGLGLAYVSGAEPLATNVATLLVMAFSSLGVIRSLVRKRQIRCACLGTVFNLPMSTVTLVEDGLMIAMSAFILVYK